MVYIKKTPMLILRQVTYYIVILMIHHVSYCLMHLYDSYDSACLYYYHLFFNIEVYNDDVQEIKIRFYSLTIVNVLSILLESVPPLHPSAMIIF